jgi:hypothetical protein
VLVELGDQLPNDIRRQHLIESARECALDVEHRVVAVEVADDEEGEVGKE